MNEVRDIFPNCHVFNFLGNINHKESNKKLIDKEKKNEVKLNVYYYIFVTFGLDWFFDPDLQAELLYMKQ